ncbi:M20/M25/M40 family metallo-hydrolase [Gynurincola endophyticus]|jgi:carboxypeptidase Q|uniref:M20/M25/M40 family metallo-hydrolase n=1 Tax=Gynurincola endophyticus TaxID=2479004 RepID=UPI0018F70CFA|nr:M20/M25/M40 family metallo-hydrolase [Gynurincola endophyticus]
MKQPALLNAVRKSIVLPLLFTGAAAIAQPTMMGRGQQQQLDPIIEKMTKEAKESSQLKSLAHHLLDKIGPRLTGTPQMKMANDWVAEKYKEWGIKAELQKTGEWTGWERGITHIDLITPRSNSLHGRQLAYSPTTNGKTVNGEVVVIPEVADKAAFDKWLGTVKGKFVLISQVPVSGRSDVNWKEFGTQESIDNNRKEQLESTQAWMKRITNSGYTNATLVGALENAGAAGVIICNWSREFGANKVFSATTKKVPHLDLSVEDYGMLFRLAESGSKPTIAVRAESKHTANVPMFNTIATIPGTEKPNEYVILSAHLDSWDGATGATDNGTGTITMMEAARILKKYYPNPKRTIIIGHWAFEEGGLNGSRAFVEDHPQIVKNVQAVFNQDNGTGRVVDVSGSGFLHSYSYITRWLNQVPNEVRQHIKSTFPGSPAGGGSDHSSFIAAGAPAFSLSSLSWGYGTITWHTNLDTYDKIVWDDVTNNVILTAALAYLASEDPEKTSNEKAILPSNPRTGQPGQWPAQASPKRSPNQ